MVIIMKYDLIALDMDGTLLNDDKVIPKENVDAIMEMQEQGKTVAICKGFTPGKVRWICTFL